MSPNEAYVEGFRRTAYPNAVTATPGTPEGRVAWICGAWDGLRAVDQERADLAMIETTGDAR